ncbi:MAG: chromate resistance protein ChrB domain-containing protein [Propylenella sp.]
MGNSHLTISAEELAALLGTPFCPPIVDVRREAVFKDAETLIASAAWRDHQGARDWARDYRDKAPVVYCAHGHNVSELAAALLQQQGVPARILAGGIDAYAAAGGPMVRRTQWYDPAGGRPSVWVTRARPKIDRIACPWLIRRFVDPAAEIHFVAAEWVRDIAEEMGGIPFDIPDVTFSHVGERCSFDTFLDILGLDDPGLRDLAIIVRGADTDRHELSPQAPGLLAVSLGLSLAYADDQQQLAAGIAIYDGLFAWCRYGRGEKHDWNPERMRASRVQS